MHMTWKLAALIAAAIYLLLFLFRFAFPVPGGGFEPLHGSPMNQATDFELGRKNYASSKSVIGFGTGGPAALPANPESQKYEKIGTLTQHSSAFDEDKTRIGALIQANGGIVQLERSTGLERWRLLHLGIGVPPEKFDTFIEAARAIGKGVAIEVVKNDKTNEYLQLKARRATLEKARTALEELRAGGGSVAERVSVQNRLTEIESQIQELGVSLGEFDSQNELCTVKLTLREVAAPQPMALAKRFYMAVESSLMDFLVLGLGFFATTLGLWLGTFALRELIRLWQKHAG